MSKNVTVSIDGRQVECPVIVGTENEPAMDIQKLRDSTGYITFDDGYGNTGSCVSKVTFIDGDKGILRYRGYPIEELAERSTFLEVAYLLIFGELPTREQLDGFIAMVNDEELLPEAMRGAFEAIPASAHPMAILSAMINWVSCYYPESYEMKANSPTFAGHAAGLISKVRTIAAFSHRYAKHEPLAYPNPSFDYCRNFLHMMFSTPNREFLASEEVARALDLILILHADHEQNCSTSTVRMVASSQANLYASCAAGVCALWGPLHGGANMAVLEMLSEIQKEGLSIPECLAKAKQKDSGFRLMGFGHRVYKNFDPRARIIKAACDRVLDQIGVKDPLLDIARNLEAAALKDAYFVERKLYPNVDFYSGIIMRAIGIPLNMFTVMFAIGRMPGWIANWKETQENPKARIYRPRQVYTGATQRSYTDIGSRK